MFSPVTARSFENWNRPLINDISNQTNINNKDKLRKNLTVSNSVPKTESFALQLNYENGRT